MSLADRISRVQHVGEMERICSLPVALTLTDAQREELSFASLKVEPFEGRCRCGARTCTTKDGRLKPLRLLPSQADGLHAFQQTGGGFFSIKVGGGKTALSILIAAHHLAKHPNDRVLLMLPANVYHQFWYRDRTWAYRHLAVGLNFVGLGQQEQKMRRLLAKSGRPGCYVLPYSCLSTEDTIDLLAGINANLAICDEGDELKDGANSAKSKRWWSYVDRRDPPPRGVVMSGSLTTRTPMDYHRLIRWALGPNSPLPRAKVEAETWSQALRSRKATDYPPTETELRAIEPLVDWARKNYSALSGNRFSQCAAEADFNMSESGRRRAFRARLTTVPGFVASNDEGLGIPIVISNAPACDPASLPGGDRLLEHIYNLETSAKNPDGEVLKFGVEQHMCYRELSAGFYSRRFWDETHPLVDRAKACFQAEQEYAKELNRFFKSTKIPRPGLDTPMVVGKYQATHGAVKGWEGLYDLWLRWRGLDSLDLPERQSEPIRVCDYKIRHAVEWAKKIKKGGIVWVYHRAVAEWLFEAFTQAGLKTISKGGGEIWLEGDGSEKYFCIASIEAHYRGKNLQHHTNQLLVQWPRASDYCEQLLGRVHRTGQQADRLVVHTNHTLDFDHEQQAATLLDTVYDQETMGGERKLLIADWNPLPRDISEDYLKERGYGRGD